MHDSEINAMVKPKLLPVRMLCEVSIQIQGLLAMTSIQQTFTNTSDEPIEAVHSIPVPMESTLTGFEVSKGDQHWRGKVLAQQEADEAYETAMEEGNGALQLKRKEDLVTLFLGNVLPKETLTITLSLIFPTQIMAGQGQIYLPLVIGERYGESNLTPERVSSSSFLAQYPVKIDLDATSISEELEIFSPSHPLEKRSHNRYSGNGLMDRDLKILMNDLPEITPSCQMIQYDDQNALGLLSMVIPAQGDPVVEPKDVLFVLDCSGSMGGSPIQQLKESVHAMLGEMRPQDRFNLYPYGSRVERVFDELLLATPENITKAKREVRRNIEANLGGTETVSALLMALMSYNKTRTTDIILVTDGEVWLNEEDVEMRLLKAYANQHNIRFFTIGVGHAASEKTVKTLAEMSNGSYLLTNPNEDIRFQMKTHFKRLFQTVVSVRLLAKTTWHHAPKVYQGDGIVIPIWLNEIPESVTFEVTVDEATSQHSLTPQKNHSNDIVKWVADQRFKSIPEAHQAEYGVKYQLLTDKTDYLVEIERAEAEKSDHLPSMVKVPQMEVFGLKNTTPDIMFSRRFNDTLDEPRFLRRQIDDDPVKVEDNASPYNPKQAQKKQEQAEIELLCSYLESLLHSDRNLELTILMQLKAPEELIHYVRLYDLQGHLMDILPRLLEVLSSSQDWESLEEKLCGQISVIDSHPENHYQG